MGKAGSNPDKSAVPVTVQFRPQTVEFLEQAAKHAGTNRTDFLRGVMIAACEEELKKEAPYAEPFELGASSPISRAAKAAGMSVREFTRQAAMKMLASADPKTYPKMLPTRERVARLKAKKAAKK